MSASYGDFELISRDEFNELMEGRESFDGSGGEGDAEERSSDDSAEDEKKDEKPKSTRGSRGKGKAQSRDEESGDGEGEDDGEEGEGGEEGSSGAGEWYSTGYAESEKLSDAEAGGYDNKAWRFFLEVGQETDVVVLDDGESDKERWDRKAAAPFNVWEHGFGIVEDPDDPESEITFYNETCVRGKLDKNGKPRKCYVCEKRKKIRRRYRSMFTILAKYEGKKGEAWSKKLLPADKKVLKIIRRHAKEGGMFGMLFSVCRLEDRSSRIGDDWSFKKTLEEAEIEELLPNDRADLSPLDYIEECRPKSYQELEALLDGATIADPRKRKRRRRGGGRGRDEGNDDDRPRGRGKDEGNDDRRREDDDRPRGRGRDRDDDREERGSRRGRSEGKDEGGEDRPRRRSDSKPADDQQEQDEPQEAPAGGDAGDDIPF